MIKMNLYELKSEKLKVLAHPHRLCIAKGLLEKKCNVTAMQECLDIPQSTVSQHISRLRTAGIICGKRNGTEIEYSVVDEDAINVINVLFCLKK
ncbi:MAG: metalloregulator ArsR/SmtB family transcription factor [Clostridiales bacterium]